jgi:Putative Ig domain
MRYSCRWLIALWVCWLSVVVFAQRSAPPLAIATESLTRPLVQRPYEAQLQATGGIPPRHWKISRGNLPDGLALDESSGVISGVVKEVSESDLTVSVVDSVGNTISRDFKLKVVAPLPIEWSKFPRVEGDQISGSVKVANGTRDLFDLTVIILAVNEYGKAFALGYRHLELRPETGDVEIPFGSSLPQGVYVVHADAIAEIAEKHTIYRARQQTPTPLQITPTL